MAPLIRAALLALAFPAAAQPVPAAGEGGPEIINGVPFHPDCRGLTAPAPIRPQGARDEFDDFIDGLLRQGVQASMPGKVHFVMGKSREPKTGAPELVTGTLSELRPEDEGVGDIHKLVIRRAFDDVFAAHSWRLINNGVSLREDVWHFEVSLDSRRILKARHTVIPLVDGQRPRMYCMDPASEPVQRRWRELVRKLKQASLPRYDI